MHAYIAFFPQNFSIVFPVLVVAYTSSCEGPKNRSPCSSLHTVDSGSRVGFPRNINRLQNSSGLAFQNCEYNFDLTREIGVFY